MYGFFLVITKLQLVISIGMYYTFYATWDVIWVYEVLITGKTGDNSGTHAVGSFTSNRGC